ncbi:MAG: phosphate ABC transporter ATP-binding protein [Candidatus Poribacteria bacterium]
MNDPIIKIENIRKVYDDRMVLEIPHLEFESGMIYALVGPNGAGKTTLLRLINMLEKQTEGAIYFDDQKTGDSPSSLLDIRRRMTFVMQSAVLFRTSVYNNVAYGLKVRGHNKNSIHSDVLSALEMVGLVGFEHRKAKQLSAGESQRVAIARAIVLKPKLLLMDEPTANVDRRNIHVIESILGKINADLGTTIIFTTHDLSQAHRLTNKVISLLDGKVVYGSSENIFYGSFEVVDQNGFIAITPDVRLRINEYNSDSYGVHIDPKDIVVSFESQSSEDVNCLEGRVTSVAIVNDMVRLTINVGIELIAEMEQKTFNDMSSGIFNYNVYALFKVSNVHVF